MRLGLNLGYSGAHMHDVLPLVERADDLGYHSVWVAESYGSDAVSILGYLAGRTRRINLGSAILQMPARTPANTAMTAMTLDALSDGRLLLGLGLSGPQVVEGWHGTSYARPLARTREYVDIVRRIVARREPLTYDGDVYRIPYDGDDATGLGKPLKSILHPERTTIPIYLAAIGPANVRLTAEIADGWLPIFYSPEREDIFGDHLAQGLARGERAPADLSVCVKVPTVMGDDVDACRDALRPMLALYIGGMGARGRNFYHDLAARYGFADAADEVQNLFLDGRRAEAAGAVPDALVDEVCLVGPLGRIKDRLEVWKQSRVDVLTLGTDDVRVVETLADAV